VQLEFDLMIAAFLGFGVLLVWSLGIWPKVADLAGLGCNITAVRALVWFYIIVGITVAWGSFIEPYLVRVEKRRFRVGDWPRPAKDYEAPAGGAVRVAVVGDIHAGHHNGPLKLRRWVKKINEQDADLVLILGDFLEEHILDLKAVRILKTLKEVKSRNGIFAVPGNHDYGIFIPGRKKRDDILESMTAELGENVRFMFNDVVELSINGRDVCIVGLDDCWSENMDGQKALGSSKGLKIIMVHNPDALDSLGGLRDALVVSGHTHGGQIRLPLLGQIVKQTYTKYGRRYSRGIFDLGHNSLLLVTSGLGSTTTRARLFCPPEIVVLEIY
jgi:predicted MPP superfamily phosphohydrolase